MSRPTVVESKLALARKLAKALNTVLVDAEYAAVRQEQLALAQTIELDRHRILNATESAFGPFRAEAAEAGVGT